MIEYSNPDRLLTPDDAAVYLGVTRKTLENWRGAGTGPAYHKLSGKCIRYELGDIKAFVETSRRTSTARG